MTGRLAVVLTVVLGSAGAVAQEPVPPPSSDTGRYGVRVVQDGAEPELETQTSHTGNLSPFLGAGYQHGLTDDAMGHLVFGLGLGWVAHGEFTGRVARGRPTRVEGRSTEVHLLGQVAVPVTRPARRTQLLLGLRGQQVFALGRHALLAVASAGARLDTGDRAAGLEVTFGGGYALLLPPVVLPIVVEVVYERFGVYGDGAWGLRVSVAW
ncbi:MAG: hypothetical protein ACOCXM_11255 [Myxococcota bacterium]